MWGDAANAVVIEVARQTARLGSNLSDIDWLISCRNDVTAGDVDQNLIVSMVQAVFNSMSIG